MNKNFDYLGNTFQIQLLNQIVVDKDFSSSILDVIEANYFDNKYFKIILQMIKEYYVKYESTPNFETLEQIIKSEVSQELVAKIVLDTLKQVKEAPFEGTQFVQEKALKFNKQCYPKGIFNPAKVSDIVSLNFDTTAEEICRVLAKQRKVIYNPVNFISEQNEKLEIPCWEVRFKKNELIRFWHPHGSILDKDKITLGTREYAKRFQTIERLRKHSKSEKDDTPASWYHQIVHNPILVLGAELSKDEWDIWFALVNRERNFAKNKNQQFKYPIFQMRECECKKDVQHEWFQPLFTGMSFKQQWQELEKLFKNQIS